MPEGCQGRVGYGLSSRHARRGRFGHEPTRSPAVIDSQSVCQATPGTDPWSSYHCASITTVASRWFDACQRVEIELDDGL